VQPRPFFLSYSPKCVEKGYSKKFTSRAAASIVLSTARTSAPSKQQKECNEDSKDGPRC
jgi:hypothetical protein